MEHLNEKNFEEKIKNGVVLIDFYASWCGPCRMLAPILEDVQVNFGDKVQIHKVDVDDNEKLARSFGIMSIPTLILFENGQQKEKHVGLMMQDEIEEMLEKYVLK